MMEANDTSQQQKPKKSAFTTVLAVGIVVALAWVILSTRTRDRGVLPPHIACGTNMSGIVKAMMVYTGDDEQNQLPPGDKWCDYLVGYDWTSPKQFVCKSSDAVEGESSYAINKYLAGKSLNVPGDLVLLFETDFGTDPNGRSEPAANRIFYEMLGDTAPNKMVYKYRWNQTGGPELLTVRHNNGKGCNVAFVDCHVEFVKAADLPKLKFKPDPNEWDRVYNAYYLSRPESR
ncbi:MAG: hypothetical protein ACYTEL_21565 [Planctomycetota bacterium]